MEQSLKRKSQQLRFFYHYHKRNRGMTVHYKNICHHVKDVVCLVPCETKWNKSQPQLIMRGWAKNIKINNEIAYIE